MRGVFSLESAKAWVSLLGAVLTALAASLPEVPTALTVALAIVTAVATWLVPNKESADD